MARRVLPVTALVAALAACAVPLVPPHRFDRAAAPDIHTILLLAPQFIHQSRISNDFTFVPSYGGPLLMAIPTREGQPQSDCGVPELDTPRVSRRDGWAGGTALAESIFDARLKRDIAANRYEVLTTPLDTARTWDAYLVIHDARFDCLDFWSWHFERRKGLQLTLDAELVRESDRRSLMRVTVVASPVPSIGLQSHGVLLPDDPARVYRASDLPAASERVLTAFRQMIERAADMVASYME